MSEFYFRSENIRNEDLVRLFVGTSNDLDILSSLKSTTNIIIEGSRGTGKSFLMKLAAFQMEQEFETKKILPIYITFMGSTLLHTNDPNQFRNWMAARIIREVLKSCRKKGILIGSYASSLLTAEATDSTLELRLTELIQTYEDSYRSPNQDIDTSLIPEINEFVEAFNEICTENDLKGINFFFDEAAHVFRPSQQRQFFTLFRDLRSPYISAKASVYPGVTHFGTSFEMVHDALHKKLERSLQDSDYLATMTEIVIKQTDASFHRIFNEHREMFNTLAFAASGNPRVLLKTVERVPKLRTIEVESTLRSFYRNEIWAEHTSLGQKYNGHKELVDWGRKFLEDHVIPDTLKRIVDENGNIRPETTIYFWIHKDAPHQVKEALRLITYTGIIKKLDDGVKGTRSQIGTRYEINYGVILAQIINPTSKSRDIISRLQLNRFSQYGQAHSSYDDLTDILPIEPSDSALLVTINQILEQHLDNLDLTRWQKNKLINEAGLSTIRELLETPEDTLISQLELVGKVRARQMKNAAVAEVLEYISG